jgi:hypothetical protein
MISYELRCILVHVQKTGGSSIRQAMNLPQADPHKHRFAAELQLIYGPEAWSDYFKFAFVRNPWDRLVSWWEMIRRNAAEGRPLNGFQRYVITHASSFEEFIRNCDSECRDGDGSKWIYRNQLDYLTDASGRLIVDFVGRYENLQADFDIVTQRLGLKRIALPHVNRSMHRHYAQYYSSESESIVGQRYARDLAAFGYQFERPEAMSGVV